jgi:hypothetical protein
LIYIISLQLKVFEKNKFLKKFDLKSNFSLHLKMNKDIILKNLSNKEDSLDTDTIIHSFTPMLDTLQNTIKNDNKNDDSTCTRIVRKKFICIIIFLLTLIVFMNLFNTVTEKLSQDDVQEIYQSLTKFIRKIPPITTRANTTNIATTLN